MGKHKEDIINDFFRASLVTTLAREDIFSFPEAETHL